MYLDILPPGQAEHDRVLDLRVHNEGALDVFRIHLHAVGQRDHVLLTTMEMQPARSVEEAQVAGVVPAIAEGLGRRRGVLPVPARYMRTTHQDLTVLGDFDLTAG